MAKHVKRESIFQARVIDLAHLYGWRVSHFRTSRTSSGGWSTAVAADGVGFPDLLMIHRQKKLCIVAELKVGRNKTSDEQDRWLSDFEAANIPAFIWYPSDEIEIEDTLKNGPAEL